MWVCTNCNFLFEDPDYWEESHGFNDGQFEKWSGCPKCGDRYVKAHECDCCGEFITGEYVKTEDGERYCENCYARYEIGEEE